MPSGASAESAGLLLFLMTLEHPDADACAAINAAAGWFKKTAIYGQAFRAVDGEGHRLVAEAGAGPIWARYYEIGTDRPLFGDRDKSIHDKVEELSRERRDGYAWYNDSAKRALESYKHWLKIVPQKTSTP